MRNVIVVALIAMSLATPAAAESLKGLKLPTTVSQTDRVSPSVRLVGHPDPVWDGALKGAAFGLVMMLIGGAQGCTDASACVLGATVGWAAIGAGIDYMHVDRMVLYRPKPAVAAAPTVSWRVRF